MQSQELPDADDEFAQEASEFDTIEELRSNIAGPAHSAGPPRAGQPGPRRRVGNPRRSRSISRYRRTCSNPRSTPVGADHQQLGPGGSDGRAVPRRDGEDQTEDEFWADLEERAAQALKAQIILDKVSEERSIDVDQNHLTQYIVRKAQADGVPPQQVADHLKEHPHHIEEYMLEIRRGKALAMIVESATVTDSDGSVIELARLRGGRL